MGRGLTIPSVWHVCVRTGIAWDCVRAGPSAQSRFESLLAPSASSSPVPFSLPDFFHVPPRPLSSAADLANPLLALYVSRWRETAHLFLDSHDTLVHPPPTPLSLSPHPSTSYFPHICRSCSLETTGVFPAGTDQILFSSQRLVSSQLPDVLASPHPPHATLAWSPLDVWRDSCRDMPAALYAFATPSPAALDAIASAALPAKKILEIGAGSVIPLTLT